MISARLCHCGGSAPTPQWRRFVTFSNIVIGIIGALVGGFLLSFFLDTAAGGWWFTLFTAILGSVILLWAVGLVQKKT